MEYGNGFVVLISSVVSYKVTKKKFGFTEGFWLKMLESLGSLEIKWKLFFKTDGMALRLGCYMLTNIDCGSLFSLVLSRNKSFLSTFVTCVIGFLSLFHGSHVLWTFSTWFRCQKDSSIFLDKCVAIESTVLWMYFLEHGMYDKFCP